MIFWKVKYHPKPSTAENRCRNSRWMSLLLCHPPPSSPHHPSRDRDHRLSSSDRNHLPLPPNSGAAPPAAARPDHGKTFGSVIPSWPDRRFLVRPAYCLQPLAPLNRFLIFFKKSRFLNFCQFLIFHENDLILEKKGFYGIWEIFRKIDRFWENFRENII